jgi:carbon storage regulator CsrA
MLVLTRKHQEKIRIGNNITITILKTKGKAVRVGIEAPSDVPVVRGELAASAESVVRVGEDAAQSTSETVSTPRRGRTRVSPATTSWTTESRPSVSDAPRRRQPAVDVGLQRVPRRSVAQILPRIVGEAGPLRSMMDQQRASV